MHRSLYAVWDPADIRAGSCRHPAQYLQRGSGAGCAREASSYSALIPTSWILSYCHCLGLKGHIEDGQA